MLMTTFKYSHQILSHQHHNDINITVIYLKHASRPNIVKLFWFSKKCKRCRYFIFRYLVVLGICWLPDKVTLILNLTHLLNLDAELCYSWRLICNILIMLNGSLNPGCVL